MNITKLGHLDPAIVASALAFCCWLYRSEIYQDLLTQEQEANEAESNCGNDPVAALVRLTSRVAGHRHGQHARRPYR